MTLRNYVDNVWLAGVLVILMFTLSGTQCGETAPAAMPVTMGQH